MVVSDLLTPALWGMEDANIPNAVNSTHFVEVAGCLPFNQGSIVVTRTVDKPTWVSFKISSSSSKGDQLALQITGNQMAAGEYHFSIYLKRLQARKCEMACPELKIEFLIQ